jgi:hypothetical protein
MLRGGGAETIRRYELDSMPGKPGRKIDRILLVVSVWHPEGSQEPTPR